MAELEYTFISNTSQITIPDTSQILLSVETEWKSIFGDSFSVEPSTPQGRIISLQAAERKGHMALAAKVANQLNIDTATGWGLDAFGSLFGSTRTAAKKTEVLATISGVAGTIIPAGSKAKTSNGDVFETQENVTIGTNGEITAYFYAEVAGLIPCPVGSLNKIVTPINGWESITNGLQGKIGTKTESDYDYRNRLKGTRYKGVALIESIDSALLNTEGVIDHILLNNGKDTAVTFGNVTVNPHSICAIVQGGSDADIAKALFEKTTAGCGYTAIQGQSVTQNVIDKIGSQNFSVTYPITFNRPENVQIQIQISVAPNKYTGSNLSDDVKKAVVDWSQNKVQSVEGLRIGKNVFTYEIGAGVSALMPEIIIQDVKACVVGGTLANSPVSILMSQLAVLEEENITVEVSE